MNKNNYLSVEQLSLDELVKVLSEKVTEADLPFADDIIQQVPVYTGSKVLQLIESDDTGEQLKRLQSEWHWVWSSGPGILVFKNAFDNLELLDSVTTSFKALIDEEKQAGKGAGDHFAKPGANDRIWNALEKLCIHSPELFAKYYANPILAKAAEAWLGPNYQITSQVNSVNPGGEAQVAHRDYHLGFMTTEQAVNYPQHIHQLSSHLTLQCAVAHVDMPLESGPTLYLPHSQKYSHGYLLADFAPFHEYFAEHRVQLPLEKGDLVMFNPALLHAAGSNKSKDIKRLANLLQISSAFGRAMESVDRYKMSCALYPFLLDIYQNGDCSQLEIDCSIAACAEGYAFPTNLDRDPPIGGLAPASQAALMKAALSDGTSPTDFEKLLAVHANKRLT
jgi:ectoine hydroxylase-related dioxygenase (phytanoyl-CoA dioxygenase family)